MLTLSSEPRPQTVLMEPMSSVPPSFVNYGLTSSGRSPRNHHLTERRAAPKPYDKTTSHSRARHTDTVSESRSVPSTVERMPPNEPLTQERLDSSVSSENICDKLTRPQISSQKPRLAPLPDVTLDHSHVTSSSLPQPRPLLAQDDAAPKGWVMGPLFQSLRSKMASFTEIVMSPFKSNDPPTNELPGETTAEGFETEELSLDAETTREEAAAVGKKRKAKDKSDVEPEVARVKEAEERGKAGRKLKKVKTAAAEEEEEEPAANRENQETQLNMSPLRCAKPEEATDFQSDPIFKSDVPLQTLQTELESSVAQSAWNATTTAFTTTTTATTSITASSCKVVNVAEEESASRGARTRKRPNKATPKAAEVSDNSNELTQRRAKDTDCNVFTNMDSKINREDVGEHQADQTPTSPSILEDASLKKVKRTLDLSCDTGKRRKTGVIMEQGAEPAQTRKPTLNSVTKAVTRSRNKSCRVEVGLTTPNESNAGVSVDLRNGEEASGAKAQAKNTKRTKVKANHSLDTQTEELTLDAKTTREEATAVGKKRKAKDKSDVDPKVARVKEAEDDKTAAEESAAAEEVEVTLNRKASEKVSLEITPFERDAQPVSLSVEALNDKGVTKRRTRRMDPQRRRSCNKSLTKRRAEDSLSPGDLAAFHKGSSTRLLRSVSCPEIPTLHEAPWTPHFYSPPRSRSQPPQQQQQQHALPHSLSSSSSMTHHFHRSARRARRHTVCSVEVEREIAPLCLRKEVYPTRRSPSPYDPQHLSPMRALSPGASLSALASCFLSSPLAFLSKKSEGGAKSGVSSPARSLSPTVRLLSPNPAVHRALSPTVRLLSPNPAARALSPTVRLLSPNPAARALSPASPAAPSLTSLLGTSLGQLPGFHLRTDTLLDATSDAANSAVALLVCTPDQPSAPDEDTSSSSPESEELREETVHSDSEIKTLKKDQGQRKVSSIKIRKALPKPQNNLTPMGLPKAVRVKKKEFSLEEIYTNKNFNKPPESRLETIFEVPLKRKNGSESWCAPRRLKRVLEFPELGRERRPRKPSAGATKANGANSRPRRGSFREDPALASDPDSLLCAKLEELELWLQEDSS